MFIITYDRNEKGEVVETGHELDIKINSSGLVKAQDREGGTELDADATIGKNKMVAEHTCW